MPDSATQPPTEGPDFKAWAKRVGIPAPRIDRFLLWGLMAAVAIACGLVLTPGLYSQRIPEIGAQDLGKPFHAPSPYGFKAGRDYVISDGSTTEKRRQEARTKIPSVYDFDPQIEDDQRAELEQLLVAAKAGTVPENVLEEEDRAALAQGRFSQEAQSACLALLERAYATPLVASKEELQSLAGKGLVMRKLGNAGEQRLPGESPAVLDVKEARAELDRFTSVPGNFMPDAPVAQKRAVLRLAKKLIRPNLTINQRETVARKDAAAGEVRDEVITVRKGEKVLGDGELISPSHLVKVESMRAQTDRLDVIQYQLGGAGLAALLMFAAYGFLWGSLRRFKPSLRDAFLMGLVLLGSLLLLQLWISVADAIHDRYPKVPQEALYYAMPLAGGAMLIRFLLSAETALWFALVYAGLAGVMQGNSLSFALYALVGSLVASDKVSKAQDRMGIFRAGFWVGGASAFTVLAVSFASGKGLSAESWLWATCALLGTALTVPVMVMTLTPLLEVALGYASDMKLLELANLNHPALKELIVQSPGTYHHSIILGSLVEAAAEAIGANPLLARSCAYYHDLGKGQNPLFFGENQKGENPHDALAPAMSAVIIKRHVTEGMDMAKRYKLPKRVADAIVQHHGTRLVGFFHHKALKELDGRDPSTLDESLFRYPGPKPQYPEAALVMIADAVEAASRSMPEPTTQKLSALTHRLINGIFSEGQLDECDLTLKDLNLIAESFVHTLEGIFHARPAYPGSVVTQLPLQLSKGNRTG